MYTHIYIPDAEPAPYGSSFEEEQEEEREDKEEEEMTPKRQRQSKKIYSSGRTPDIKCIVGKIHLVCDRSRNGPTDRHILLLSCENTTKMALTLVS